MGEIMKTYIFKTYHVSTFEVPANSAEEAEQLFWDSEKDEYETDFESYESEYIGEKQ
jgi:hypothetical protein